MLVVVCSPWPTINQPPNWSLRWLSSPFIVSSKTEHIPLSLFGVFVNLIFFLMCKESYHSFLLELQILFDSNSLNRCIEGYKEEEIYEILASYRFRTHKENIALCNFVKMHLEGPNISVWIFV